MKEFEYILLDGFILASFPQILNLNSSYYRFVTTTHVLQDIKNGYGIAIGSRRKKRVLQAIDVALKDGELEVRSMDLDSPFTIFHGRGAKQLTSSETSLIDLANTLKQKGPVILATASEDMLPIAKRYDVQLMNLDEIIGIYSRAKAIKREDLKFEMYYRNSDLISIGKKIAIGIVIAVSLLVGYLCRGRVVGELNAIMVIGGSVLLAVLFFILRERHRIVYGVVEFLVGVTSVALIFYPTFNVSIKSFDFSAGVKFLGGIYIMIRGLDNLVKGVSKTHTGRVLKYKFRIGI